MESLEKLGGEYPEGIEDPFMLPPIIGRGRFGLCFVPPDPIR